MDSVDYGLYYDRWESRRNYNPFSKQISAMMYSFGDVKKPLQETVDIVYCILREEMNLLLLAAEGNAKFRKSGEVSHEDLLFLMRKSKGKLKRLFEVIQFLEEMPKLRRASYYDNGKKAKDSEMCIAFFTSIEDCGEFTSVLNDKTFIDESYRNMLQRRNTMTKWMDVSEYIDFTEKILQTSFCSEEKFGNFKKWLLEEKAIKLPLTKFAYTILRFLARETIAKIVDIALIIKAKKNKKKQSLLDTSLKSFDFFKVASECNIDNSVLLSSYTKVINKIKGNDLNQPIIETVKPILAIQPTTDVEQLASGTVQPDDITMQPTNDEVQSFNNTVQLTNNTIQQFSDTIINDTVQSVIEKVHMSAERELFDNASEGNTKVPETSSRAYSCFALDAVNETSNSLGNSPKPLVDENISTITKGTKFIFSTNDSSDSKHNSDSQPSFKDNVFIVTEDSESQYDPTNEITLDSNGEQQDISDSELPSSCMQEFCNNSENSKETADSPPIANVSDDEAESSSNFLGVNFSEKNSRDMMMQDMVQCDSGHSSSNATKNDFVTSVTKALKNGSPEQSAITPEEVIQAYTQFHHSPFTNFFSSSKFHYGFRLSKPRNKFLCIDECRSLDRNF